mmetsp:Transcript_35617/g.65923  ORF Transcript_35617/g.65923 Transcript_35617/m.65923 type:complete len:158 (+) Transcript_35617:967-1440(+)
MRPLTAAYLTPNAPESSTGAATGASTTTTILQTSLSCIKAATTPPHLPSNTSSMHNRCLLNGRSLPYPHNGINNSNPSHPIMRIRTNSNHTQSNISSTLTTPPTQINARPTMALELQHPHLLPSLFLPSRHRGGIRLHPREGGPQPVNGASGLPQGY